jgi:hypothetical protein
LVAPAPDEPVRFRFKILVLESAKAYRILRDPYLLNSKEEKMKNLIKILHINPSWQVIYILIGNGILVKSNVPLEKAIPMLKHEKFDLILSEPQKIAILDHQTASEIKNPDEFPLWEKANKITGKIAEYQPRMF